MTSSDDESDSNSGSGRGVGVGPSGGSRRGQQEVQHSNRGSGCDTGSGRGTGSGRDKVLACVWELFGLGYGEELQWLEAYLADEARDRTLDGKGSPV